jgi:lipopolysaccharide export system ATP-binding protein
MPSAYTWNRPRRETVGSVLKAIELVKEFGKRRVVDGVSLNVRQGEIVGLLGPNGAGKTTTFYMIVGLLKANSGQVLLDEEDLTRVPMYRRARAGIGYLSQEPSIFRRLTVEQNVMAILETLDLSRKQREHRLDELLEELSISHLRKSKAYSLSGGERRRLEITRALVTEPKFMLLDEPFAGVDPIAVDDIQRIVADLRVKGLGVLITDHNVRETLSITDRAYLLFNGRIHIEGPAQKLVEDPEARKMYLGLDFEL